MAEDPPRAEAATSSSAADAATKPPSRSLFLTIFPSIMLPMFLAVADQTIVATALPVIAADFGEVERVSWVVVSYLIANTIAAPVYGRLGDSFGRRNMMLIGLIIFMLGSVLCAFAPNMGLLTAARIVQGFGGGGLMTLSQALVGESVPPRERGRYQGYLAGVAVSSNTFGPVAGGYLTQAFGWRSIFLINVPLGLVAALLVLRLATQPSDRRRTTFDAPGLVLFIMFVGPVILALEQVQRMQASTLPMIGGLLALGVIALTALVWQEKHSTSPLIPPALFREPSVWRSDGLAACHGAALVSLITFLPLYLRAVRGTSPADTGLLLLPLTFGIGLGSLVAGQLITQNGPYRNISVFRLDGRDGRFVVCRLLDAASVSRATAVGLRRHRSVHGYGDGRGAGHGAGRSGTTYAWHRRGDGAVLTFRRSRLWHCGSGGCSVFGARNQRSRNGEPVGHHHRPRARGDLALWLRPARQSSRPNSLTRSARPL